VTLEQIKLGIGELFKKEICTQLVYISKFNEWLTWKNKEVVVYMSKKDLLKKRCDEYLDIEEDTYLLINQDKVKMLDFILLILTMKFPHS
jgi:hypothetical protein